MMQGSVRFSSLSFLGPVPPLTSSRRSPYVLICNHAKVKCFTAGYWHNFILLEIIFYIIFYIIYYYFLCNIHSRYSQCFFMSVVISLSLQLLGMLWSDYYMILFSKWTQTELRNHCHLQNYFSNSSLQPQFNKQAHAHTWFCSKEATCISLLANCKRLLK